MNSVLPANEKIVYCLKRKKKRFCDHCDRLVSIRTFNAHKRRKTVDNAKIDYTDELLSQDLRIHSDSSDLDLDFDLSSDECSEVAKFAAESPELQVRHVSGSDDSNWLSSAESSDSLHGETDDEAELQFKNLLSSSEDDDITTDKSNTTQSNNLSVLSNTSISLIIIFVMTWKVMHNLSDAAVNVLFCFLKRLLDLMARIIHCKALKVPSSIGRIPSKIASGFKGFTADQFKNWAVVFSSFALKDILPDRHLQCWKLFVKACCILCSTVISTSQVKITDDLLLEFCRSVEDLYGSSNVTPNMHLHCHLYECILDFGPVYGFWCFSFECFNGILGALHVNNHQIEVQLMRKFIERQQVRGMSWPREFDGFNDMLASADKGSLAQTKKNPLTPTEYRESMKLKADTGTDLFHLSFVDKCSIQVLSPIKEVYMSDDEVEALTTMYTFLHKEDTIVYVPKLSRQFSQLLLYDQKLDSWYSRSERSACILARWYGANGLDTASVDLRPGIVQYFFKHSITIRSPTSENVNLPYTLACVHWYKVHPHARFYFGLPIQACLPSFEVESVAAFIPVMRIDSICDVAELSYNLGTANGKEKIVVAVPLDLKLHV